MWSYLLQNSIFTGGEVLQDSTSLCVSESVAGAADMGIVGSQGIITRTKYSLALKYAAVQILEKQHQAKAQGTCDKVDSYNSIGKQLVCQNHFFSFSKNFSENEVPRYRSTLSQ